MKKIVFIFVFFLFLLPALWGIVHAGFFLSDDGNWMVIRFSAFIEALKSPQFPVRFLPRLNNGFGYPVSDFLYPLFMYIGIPIKLLGISFVQTIKIIFASSLIGSAIFSYLWLESRFSKIAALMGALVYVYFPYHLFDLYSRGSIGEMVALAIVPFLFWQIEKKNLLGSAVGISLLILAHNTLALLFLPIAIVYLFLQKRVRLLPAILAIVLGILSAAFFWFPALYDSQFTIFQSTVVANISGYFLTQKNISLVGLLFFFLFAHGLYLGSQKRSGRRVWFFLVVAGFSLFFATPASQLIWQYTPLPKVVQFPWRFLSLCILSSAFIVAYIVHKTDRWKRVIVVVYIVLVAFSAYSFLFPHTYQYYPDTFYTTNQASTTVKDEYTPLWQKSHMPNSKTNNLEIVEGNGVVISQHTRGTHISGQISLRDPSVLRVNFVYFPGWKILIDAKEQQISYDNSYGLMQVGLSRGIHSVQAYFTETPIRLVADICSFLAVIFVIGIGLRIKKYDK